jgi:hypothetical protein
MPGIAAISGSIALDTPANQDADPRATLPGQGRKTRHAPASRRAAARQDPIDRRQ